MEPSAYPSRHVFADIPMVMEASDASPTVPDLPVVRGLVDVPRFDPEDGTELLRNRFLCRGGGALLVGPTGIGKSSLTMQLIISWALGSASFGIVPARPLRFLLVQAENDDGDIAEMRDGVIAGLGLTEAQLAIAAENVLVAREDTRSGLMFIEVLDGLLDAREIDILVIDPVFSFLGCEAVDQQGVTDFLRSGLNPLLRQHQCGALLVHHTNKPNTGQNRSNVQAGDHAYLGAGAAEFANWARAVIVLKSLGRPDVFELRVAKRGSRIGWKEPDGTTARYSTQIAHARAPGQIHWQEVAAENCVVRPLANGQRCASVNKADVLKLVPAAGSILHKEIIAAARIQDIGEGRTKEFLKCLVKDRAVLKLDIPRSRTRPAIAYIRADGPKAEEIGMIDTDGAFFHSYPICASLGG